MPEEQSVKSRKVAQLRILGWLSIVIGLLTTAFMIATVIKLWSPLLAGLAVVAIWPVVLGGIVLKKAKKMVQHD